MEAKLKVFEVILVILAIILSVLWFLNPAANYEPALALLGFVLMFSEAFRRRFMSRNESVVEEVAVNAVQADSAVSNIAQDSEPSEATHSEQISGVAIEDILAGIDSKNYTGIQITQFVKRNAGVEVVWRVKVHNIKPAFEHDPKSDLYLVFSPESQQDDSFPEIIVAVFDRCNEGDLAAISSEDIAVIRGEVSFSELAGKYSPTLKNCGLVGFYKNA